MPTIKDTLNKALKTEKRVDMPEESSEAKINELVEKVFTTRNLLHFAHLGTKSYAAHMALGSLYDQIVEDVDEIVEVYQGKFGLLTGLECEAATIPSDITQHVKDEASWIETNRGGISKGYTPVENLLDTLIGHYSQACYKLENLK